MKKRSEARQTDAGPTDPGPEAAEASGIPDSFKVAGLEQSQVVKNALAFLGRPGRDPASFVKHARAARRLAWEGFKAGGSAVGMQRDVDRLHHQRGQVQGRIGGLRGKGADAARVAEAEGELAALDRDIAKRESILAAVPEADRRDYRAIRDAAKLRLDAAGAEADRYRVARIPCPADLQDRVLAAETAYVEADRAFDERRARLEAVSPLLQKEIAAAVAALATTVETAKLDQVKVISKIIAADLDRLSHFPERLPGEAIAAYRIAEQAAEIEDALRGGRGGAIGAFLREFEDDERAILAQALRLGVPGRIEAALRPRPPRPDPLMNMVT